MMPEISLNILDVAGNSIRARAALVEITVDVQPADDTLAVTVKDNGKGMTEEEVSHVEDPFFTTRTTRKVGLGIPFFRQAAVSAGGSFQIDSEKGKGTTVRAVFVLSHIDRMPLGDFGGVCLQLVTMNPAVDFRIRAEGDGKEGVLDTREVRAVLGEDISLSAPEVRAFLKDYIQENLVDIFGGRL